MRPEVIYSLMNGIYTNKTTVRKELEYEQNVNNKESTEFWQDINSRLEKILMDLDVAYEGIIADENP